MSRWPVGPKNGIGRTALSILAGLLLVYSCSLSDSERCSKGQKFEGNECFPLDKKNASGGTGGAESEAEDGDASLDAGEGGSASASTGIGTSCAVQSDCKGLKADYCAIDPTGKSSICTVQNCKTASNDCPKGYTCCEFIPSLDYPDFCMPNAQWEQYHTLTCVN
jgi:hypothetical protein